MKIAQYMRQENAIAAADSAGKFGDLSWYGEQEEKIHESTVRAAIARRQLRDVLDEGHLYVVEFTSGVVKVGKSVAPVNRLASHAKYAQIHGGDISQSWTSERHRGYSATERQLIKFGHSHSEAVVVSRGEYFRDLDFDNVQQYAELLVEHAIEGALLDQRRRADDAERRDYLDGLIAVAGDDMSWTWQQAHQAWEAEQDPGDEPGGQGTAP